MDEAEPCRLGIFPPRRDVAGPPDAEYVPRGEVEDRLRAALGKSSFILVFGPARAGKSRTALEAARQILPDAVVAPELPETAGAQALHLVTNLAVGDGLAGLLLLATTGRRGLPWGFSVL
jgi:hypothetical protein